MFSRSRKFIPKFRTVPTNCIFCTNKSKPDYKNSVQLFQYISERGKILGRNRTGVCSKHQRILTHAIKNARFLAILPFIEKK
jgi:small subunit ribosomal protein S18